MSSNPIYSFFATPGNFGPFFLRMALAVVFFFHGTQKAFGWFGGPGWSETILLWTDDNGMNLPYVFAALAVIMEVLIALSLFLGLFTRLGGLGVCIIMGAAIFLMQNTAGFTDLEYPVIVFTAGLSLLFIGGGALSIDRAVSSNLLPVVG